MRKRKILSVLALLFFAWAFLSPVYGACSPYQTETQNTVTVSKADLMKLGENNKKQREALMQSQTALEKAKAQLNESKQALQIASEQLSMSQESLTASKQETAELLMRLKQQQEETKQLKEQLTTLQTRSESASSLIAKANLSLQNTRAEFLENEKEHERTEKKLKNRITAWQIVAVFLGGAAAFK